MAIAKDFITRYGVYVQGTSAVSSSTGQTGALQVDGGAAIAKNLFVGQTSTFGNTATFSNNLVVLGNSNLSGTLSVSGLTTLANTTASGTLYVGGAATLNSTLNVAGATTLSGTLGVTGTSNLTGALTANTSTFNGPVSITGNNTLTVGTGTTTLGGALTVSGVATFNNNTEVGAGTGAVVVSGGVNVGKAVWINSTSSNTATNTSNALYVAGGAWIDRTFVVNGDTTFRGNVTFNGTQTNVYSTNTVYTDNLLNLHTPPNSTGFTHTWTLDDGKDIGFMIHYFKSTDKDAFLGWNNGSGFLEFYAESTETVAGVVTPVVYGTFRTGSIRLVDTTTATSTNSGALQVVGGIGVGDKIYAGANISGGTVTARNLTQGRIVFAGAGGQLTDDAELTYDGVLNLLSADVTSANSATNIKNGGPGQLVYQVAANQTGFVATGTSGFILQSNGASAPSWISISGVSAGSATTASNLANGTVGQLPYQNAVGSTTFFGPGNAGQLLMSNGAVAGGPSFVNTGNVFVGNATTAINIAGGAAGQIHIQSSTGTTAFIPAGSAGQILQAQAGNTATFVSTSTLLVGRAVTADAWTTARTLTLAGDLGGSIAFDGSTNFTLTATIQADSVALGTDTTGNYVASGSTTGFGISGSTSSESGVFAISINSTSSNTTSTIVYRDPSGNFSAGTITANLNGTASLATTATNLAGGTAGQVPYQSSTGTTLFTGPGNAGEILTSRGAGQPLYQNTLTLAGTTDSTSTNSGALQVVGGVGIGRTLYVGGKVIVNDTTDSAATNQGAIQTLGGVGIAKDLTVGGDITVGSVAASTVTPMIFSNNLLIATYSSPAITNTSTVNLDVFAGNSFRTAKYTIQIFDSGNSNLHVSEILVSHNGSTAYITEYGIITNNGILGTFDATYAGGSGNVTLTFTPTTVSSMVVKVARFGITV